MFSSKSLRANVRLQLSNKHNDEICESIDIEGDLIYRIQDSFADDENSSGSKKKLKKKKSKKSKFVLPYSSNSVWDPALCRKQATVETTQVPSSKSKVEARRKCSANTAYVAPYRTQIYRTLPYPLFTQRADLAAQRRNLRSRNEEH